MKKVIAAIISLVLSFTAVVPVSAESGASAVSSTMPVDATSVVDSAETFAANTAIIQKCNSDDGEKNIKCVLKIVLDVLTVALGVVASIGIAVSGIQYLTAGGNEERTRKSKRRIFEIVIGIVAYLLIYAALNWLIPDFQGV